MSVFWDETSRRPETTTKRWHQTCPTVRQREPRSTGVSAASLATEFGLAVPPGAMETTTSLAGKGGPLPTLFGFLIAHPVYAVVAAVGLALVVLGDRAPLP